MKHTGVEFGELPAAAMVLLSQGSSYRFIKEHRSGVSGARVLLFECDGQLHALKYIVGECRVPIAKQIQNRNLLSSYLDHRMPKILDSVIFQGGGAMLMEAVDGATLHDLTVKQKLQNSEILDITKSILGELKTMWLASKRKGKPSDRNPNERIQRVSYVATASLSELGCKSDSVVVINGKVLGTAGSLLQSLDSYRPPSFSVCCHSDLNADNFPVDAKKDWHLVDWEWAGSNHDWRQSLSHLLGWWRVNATQLKGKPVSQMKRNRLEISYQIDLPEVCSSIEKVGLAEAESFASQMDDPGWSRGYKTLVATFLLGESRFSSQRGRDDYNLPNLGEGLKLLSVLQ